MPSISDPFERESAESTALQNLLDKHDVARFFDVSVATVRRWRWLKTGPRFYRIGASVRYRLADLEAFLQSRPTGGGPAEGR